MYGALPNAFPVPHYVGESGNQQFFKPRPSEGEDFHFYVTLAESY
jgi:hypothetical protein